MELINMEFKDILMFILAAAPWALMGVALAYFIAKFPKKKKENETGNYAAEGMCIGLSVGSLYAMLVKCNYSLGLSLGMLIGVVVGSTIEKK